MGVVAMQVKQTLKWSAAALMTLSAGLAYGQGIDELVAKVHPNYVTDEMLLNGDKDQNNWMLYGKDYQSTRYSGLTGINQGNVKKMTPAWNMSFGVLDGQDSQAVVVNGTVYVTTSYNKVIAVNAVTGEIIWKYERELPGDVYPKLCCDVVNRGVAVYKNKVYLATLDAHIVALTTQPAKWCGTRRSATTPTPRPSPSCRWHCAARSSSVPLVPNMACVAGSRQSTPKRVSRCGRLTPSPPRRARQ